MVGPAGTDALSYQLGLARVRLGMNMAATALPTGEATAGAQHEDVVVYFGIIDILQVLLCGAESELWYARMCCFAPAVLEAAALLTDAHRKQGDTI